MDNRLGQHPIWLAAIIGLAVPAYWMSLEMLLFSAPSDIAVLSLAERITYLPKSWEDSWPPFVGPLVNAALYAAICAGLRILPRVFFAGSREQPAPPVEGRAPSMAERDRREKRWFVMSMVLGETGSFLLADREPGAPMIEIIGGVVIFGLFLGAFVYVAFLMARLFAWSVTSATTAEHDAGR